MTNLSNLASRVEDASRPDRELDRAIQLAIRKPVPSDRWTGRDEIPPQKPRHFTTSLDAALTLVPEGVQADSVVREAVSAVAKRFDLHISFWPKDESYRQWLACYAVAASLRARSEMEKE